MSSATENTEDQGGWLEVEVNCNGESESESNSDPESGSESGSSFGSESNEASSGSDSECEGGDSDFGVDDQIDVDSDFDNHFDVEDSDVAGVKVIAVTKIMKDSEEGHSHNNIEEADRFFQSGTGTDCLAEDWNCHDTELGNISNAGQSQDEYVGHQVGHMHIEILGQPKMGKSALQKTLVKVLSSSSRGWGDCCDGFGVDCANTNIDELVALQHPNSVSCIIFSRNETGSENVTVNNEPAVGVNAKSNRNQNSLNCCIYALPPHHMSALDEAHLTAIAENGHFDVVLPVICKAETMSIDERKQYSEDLKAFFESQEKLDQLITSEPVAVVCEERHYTWGSVSPLDPRVSQIDKLCDYLESHIQLKRKVIRDNAPYTKDDAGSGFSVQQLDKVRIQSVSGPNKGISMISMQLQKRFMILLATGLAFLMLQLFYSGKTYQYVIVFVSEVGLCASLIVATTKAVHFRDNAKAEIASTTVSVCFASILVWHYIFDGAKSDGTVVPVNARHAVQENMNMSLRYLENLLSAETSTAQNLSAQLTDALSRFRTCERNLGVMQSRFESSLAHTNLRLENALELCGSWCDGI